MEQNKNKNKNKLYTVIWDDTSLCTLGGNSTYNQLTVVRGGCRPQLFFLSLFYSGVSSRRNFRMQKIQKKKAPACNLHGLQ